MSVRSIAATWLFVMPQPPKPEVVVGLGRRDHVRRDEDVVSQERGQLVARRRAVV
jgi:hypothetical protein